MTDSHCTYWRITKDHLDLQDLSINSRVGQHYGSRLAADAKGMPVIQIRLYDDDRILYYEGEATDDTLEYVWAWAARDAGVTILQTQQNGEWKDCIG